MKLPNQAKPVDRSMNQAQPSEHHSSVNAADHEQSFIHNSGITVHNSGMSAAGYEQCYKLPSYLAQQMCLRM